MNPQLNKIFSKLAKEDKKTELKSEKVELALVDEYNSRIDQANNFRKQASVTYAKTEGSMKSASIQMDLAVKEAEKIEKMAKDLGVNSPINLGKVKSKAKEFSKVVSFLQKGKIN